jgi:plastocyanin
MRAGSRILLAATFLAAMTVPNAQAFHLFRDCTSADGARGDGASATPAATVMVLHNTFNDTSSGAPVTRVHVGDTVKWTWNSVHCHSVQADTLAGNTSTFYSGFLYPTTAPDSPFVHPSVAYPVPELNPTLSYSHTFTSAGTYHYQCEHHYYIGMQGVVIVE